jgi:hypothetical protein
MKPIKKSSILSLIILLVALTNALAQNKVVVKEKQPRNKVVVVKNKNHHIRKARVYHPHWAPRAGYMHRWIYFPRHNFYWDNFRNVYLIRTGTVWVISKTTPKEIEKVELSKEKKVELGEENDSLDSIEVKNDDHQKIYKDN